MNNNYMTYPMKNMRITCRYDQAAHAKHCINVTDGRVDYPIDDAGYDSGRDAIYCPCDEMKVTAIRGLGNPNITNTIWLVSTTPVITPTFTDIAFLVLTHSNDDDFKNIGVGSVFKRGEVICYEGTSGASANHIHLTCGRGYSDNWLQNSNGSWVMTGNSLKPEEVFFIDRSFTTELWGGSLIWKDLPTFQLGTPVLRDTSKEQIEVIVDNLNARSYATTTSNRLGYINRGIYNVLDSKDNEGYLWKKIENFWVATNDKWVKYYDKVEVDSKCQEMLNKVTKELEEIKNSNPRLIYTCERSGKYIIYLEKGKNLYIL